MPNNIITRQEITQKKEIFDFATNTFILIEGLIGNDDPLFSLALKDFERLNGYNGIEKHPEVEIEVRKLLEDIPDDNQNKRVILEKFPNLTYLEQTFILDKLIAEKR